MNKQIVDLNDLPLEAFDIDNAEIQVESLTAGHGIAGVSASCGSCCPQCCSC